MIRLKLVEGGPDHAPCGTLAVGLFQGERGPKGEAGWVDWRLGGALSRAIAAGRVDGAAGTTLLMPAKKLPCKRVLIVGLGPQGDFKGRNLETALEQVLEKVGGFQDTDLAVALPGTKPWPAPRNAAELLGEKLLQDLAAAGRSATITILGTRELLTEIKEWVRAQPDPVHSHVSLDEDSLSRSEARETP